MHALTRPVAGTKLDLEIVRAPSTSTQPPDMGTVGVHLALHAVHMDYIMRVHSTGWYGPTADHPGGWCKCFRGHALPALPPPPAAPAGRGRKRARKQKKVRLLGAWGRSLESVGGARVHRYCITLGRDAGAPPRKPWGYSKPIKQPALNGRLAKCGADALQLTDSELAADGEFTHSIDCALQIGDPGAKHCTCTGMYCISSESAATETMSAEHGVKRAVRLHLLFRLPCVHGQRCMHDQRRIRRHVPRLPIGVSRYMRRGHTLPGHA